MSCNKKLYLGFKFDININYITHNFNYIYIYIILVIIIIFYSDISIDVAELLNVCWLEVHGKFDTTELSPGVLYEVAFVIMLKDPAYGWEVPVYFRLTLPNGIKQERKEILMTKPRVQWIEIPVGEFIPSQENCGEMEISMFEYSGGKWKRGIVVKGVIIRPKHC